MMHEGSVPDSSHLTALSSGPIRVGLLTNSLDQPRWTATVLRRVRDSAFADLVAVISEYDRSDGDQSRAENFDEFRHGWPRRWRYLVYSLYTAVDHLRYGRDAGPRKIIDIEPLIKDLPALQLSSNQSDARLNDTTDTTDQVQKILSYDLDVVLCFGGLPDRYRGLPMAKHGVWDCVHGDPSEYRGRPSGFWEVMEDAPTVGTALMCMGATPCEDRILARSYSSTDRFSVTRTLDRSCQAATQLIVRTLRDLHLRESASLLTDNLHDSSYRPYAKRIYRAPTNSQMISLAGTLVRRWMRSQIDNLLTHDQWIFASRYSTGDCDRQAGWANRPASTFHDARILVPPRDRFWADPFPVAQNGVHYVFFEEFLESSGKGHINVLKVDPNGTPVEPEVVLAEDYHLSYPFIFRWRSEWFMIPESADAGRITLYRATDFPNSWTVEAHLFDDMPAVDTTLSVIDDRWWMFTNLPIPGTRNWDQELYLFHAPDPLGPWTPHTRNPVKSDVRNSRSAGRLFRASGKLYRPAQNCAIRYGHSITINRIDVINKGEFRETPVGTITPDWHGAITATHTLNASGRLTVIDARLRRRFLPGFDELRKDLAPKIGTDWQHITALT